MYATCCVQYIIYYMAQTFLTVSMSFTQLFVMCLILKGFSLHPRSTPFSHFLMDPIDNVWPRESGRSWAMGVPMTRHKAPCQLPFHLWLVKRRPWTIGPLSWRWWSLVGLGTRSLSARFLFDSPCSFEATSRCIYSPPPSDNTEAALPVIALQPF